MMQNKKRFVSSLFGALLLTLMAVLTVSAQQPTATPTDPAWLAFSAARQYVQQEKKVDLTLVRRWEFYQDDWSTANAEHPQRAAGIDGCVSTKSIVLARPIFYGWTVIIVSLRGETYVTRVSFDTRDVALCDIGVSRITDAAQATPVPADSSLPAPVAGSAAIGGFELGGHVQAGLVERTVNAMRTAGMTWAKLQVRHDTPLSYATNFLADAKAKGFKVLFSMLGDHNRLAVDFDGEVKTFADRAAALAAAGADAIEVWNEPNFAREWIRGQVSGASYVRLLAPVSVAIRNANKKTMIISAAPTPTGFYGAAGCTEDGCNDDVWMRQVAEAGGAQYFDCLGLHYNEGTTPPSANSGQAQASYYPTYFFGANTSRGQQFFPGKPVCYTELGYLTGEGYSRPIPGTFGWAARTTVAQQAAWLAEAAVLAAQRGVRLMIVWNVDFTRFDDDPMGGYAIIRPDGSCPACIELGKVMKK